MKRTKFAIVLTFFTVLSLFSCASSADIDTNVDNIGNDDNVVMEINGIIEEKTEDDLFEQSSLLIIGTVGESNSFQIEKANGGTGNFTDYEINISKILRGERRQSTATVRVQGGTALGVTEVYNPSPELESGEEYLLFLYKPSRGGSFNTEGDYYYILGLTQGIFQEVSSSTTTAGNVVYKSQSGYEIGFDRISERATEYPIDELYFRTEYIENQKRNLANGFITEDEYEKKMAEIDVYASKVTGD